MSPFLTIPAPNSLFLGIPQHLWSRPHFSELEFGDIVSAMEIIFSDGIWSQTERFKFWVYYLIAL